MFEMDKEQFGKFMLELRKEKGLTQKELADRLYVSDKTVSKWECGKGMPDITMLVPLAEQLGVSVAELLECQRRDPNALLNTSQVDDIVQKALQVSEWNQKTYIRKKNRILIYCVSVLVGALQIAVALLLKLPMNVFWTCGLTFVLLGACFGAWFTWGAKAELPPYYDEYKIDSFSDGMIRMNLPGISFNNKNWPHIVKAGWVWCIIMMLICPMLCVVAELFIPGAETVLLAVGLPVFLGSFFGSFYIAAAKHR